MRSRVIIYALLMILAKYLMQLVFKTQERFTLKYKVEVHVIILINTF